MIDVEKDGAAVILHQSQLLPGSKTDPVSTVWLGSFVSEVPRDFKTAVDSTISNGNIFLVCGKNNINRMCFRTRASAFLACFVNVSSLSSAAFTHTGPWRLFFCLVLFSCFKSSSLVFSFHPQRKRKKENASPLFFGAREGLSWGNTWAKGPFAF